MREQSLNMLSPILKTIPELLANYDSFKERSIQDYEGQKKQFNRIYVNPYLDFIFRKLRPTSELDKLIGKPYDDVSLSAKGSYYLFGGKLYQIDKKKMKNINGYLRRTKVAGINRDLKNARNVGDKKEVNRLLELKRKARRGE